MPEVTVLMPVKNGEKYVKEAIDSVLRQSFEDWEFLIVDYGSTDRTVSIIRCYVDARIRLMEQKSDVVEALNTGLAVSKGEFIAQMGADAVMHSERIRIQHKRMRQNPDISICATWTKPFREDGSLLPPFQYGSGYVPHFILRMLKGNLLIHPSVMLRKSFFDRHELRYQNYTQAEDYKLWFEVAKAGGKIFVEPQLLLNFRVADVPVAPRKSKSIHESTLAVRREILRYLLHETEHYETLLNLYQEMHVLEKEGVVSSDEIFQLFGNMLARRAGLNTQ